MQGKKVFKSAVVVMPPKGEWPPIQAIRAKHDKAYVRWPPHINLLYPFIPERDFAQAVEPVRAALSAVQPFKVRFEGFDFFEHGITSTTLFCNPKVEPSGALHKLQAALESVFPFCNDLSTRSSDGFHPHLTVGQFRGKRDLEKHKANFVATWKPIEFTVSEVYFISRTDTSPFEVIHTIPLGQTSASTSAPPSSSSASIVSGGGKSFSPASKAYKSSFPALQSTFPKESIASSSPSPLPSSAEDLIQSRIQPLSDSNINTKKSGEGTALSDVLKRIERWIQSRNGRDHLPKKKYKLMAAIKPMCHARRTNVDVNTVIQNLQNEGFISLAPPKGRVATIGGNTVKYLKKRSQEEQQRLDVSSYPSSSSYGQYNNDYHSNTGESTDQQSKEDEVVMARCREWVAHPLNVAKTEDGLRNSLLQLCRHKLVFETEQVLNALVANGVVSVDYDDNVSYHV
ncbi:2'-5' RNA ligase [Balamuthia mandrillaris]